VANISSTTTAAANDTTESEGSGHAVLLRLGSAEKRKAQFMDMLAPKSGVGKFLQASLHAAFSALPWNSLTGVHLL
jgi:hypothetical protein